MILSLTIITVEWGKAAFFTAYTLHGPWTGGRLIDRVVQGGGATIHVASSLPCISHNYAHFIVWGWPRLILLVNGLVHEKFLRCKSEKLI